MLKYIMIENLYNNNELKITKTTIINEKEYNKILKRWEKVNHEVYKKEIIKNMIKFTTTYEESKREIILIIEE